MRTPPISRQRTNRATRKLTLEPLCERQLLAADVMAEPETQAGEAELSTLYYSIDGAGNNLESVAWGSVDQTLIRYAASNYADGVSAVDESGPSARLVSNIVAAQEQSVVNDRHLTDIVWIWGQFLDHDIDLTEGAGTEILAIEVPIGDPYFDPDGTGTAAIFTTRSTYNEDTGVDDPRQQTNGITAWIDGSVIYGSDEERAAALREGVGGRLLTSTGDLLPFNEQGLDNAGGPSSALFLAGDVRANENIALTAMHTVWVREHNRIADGIAAENPELSDEEIYQEARAIVVAELQAITYNEFLPALLGADAIDAYEGYDPDVNPNVANEFSTAAYRFGHSMLSPELLRLDADGGIAEEGAIALRSAFFSPGEITAYGIDSILMGALTQEAQEIDTQVVDDIRNFLFGEPGAGGFDLASLNIQRGRDHGLGSYNDTRVALGLEAAETFGDITSDAQVAAALEAAYGDVDSVELWVGGLAEDAVAGGSLGELFTEILADQFERLRDGDRLYYENQFEGRELEQIESTTLASVIERNTGLDGLRDNIFFSEQVALSQSTRAGETRLETDRDGDVVINQGRRRQSVDSAIQQIVLEGRDHAADDFFVDARALDGLPDGVVIQGGQGDGDALVIDAVRGDDTIQVVGSTIWINDIAIETGELERIVLRVSDQDTVDSELSELDVELVAVDERRERGGRGGDRQRRDPPDELSALDAMFADLGRRR